MDNTKIFYTWEMFDEDIQTILDKIKDWEIKGIYGVPKGGLVLAVTLANYLNLKLYTELDIAIEECWDKLIITDDISDTGNQLFSIIRGGWKYKIKTITIYEKEKTIFHPTLALHTAPEPIWVSFPWEPNNKEAKRDGTKINTEISDDFL